MHTIANAARKLPEVTPARTVGSFTEWDPLEEILLGDPLGATRPGDMRVLDSAIPLVHREVIDKLLPGRTTRFPSDLVREARRAIGELRATLEGEGIKVSVAAPISCNRPIHTPFWEVKRQFCSANPRDSILIVGDLLIEAPMADRSRYFETFSYRETLRDLSDRGAKWIAAPKPMLKEDSFETDLARDADGHPTRWITTEAEPLFDAADFLKFGRDIMAMRSHVTNEAGIEWVRQIVAPEFSVHTIETINPYAMHIDDTIMPLREGVLLYSPDYVDQTRLPKLFSSWDLIPAPKATVTDKNRVGSLSGYLNVNLLSIDDRRVIVERSQEETIRLLRKCGMSPIPCEFEAYYPFAGSFHCASLDVFRRGELRSCF